MRTRPLPAAAPPGLGGNFLSDVVMPGDEIEASVTQNAASMKWTIKDGWTESGTESGSAPSHATIGMIAVNCSNRVMPCSPIPHFSKVTFTGAKINTKSLVDFKGAVQRDIVASENTIEVTSSKLLASEKFTATWKSSCAPVLNRC